MRASAVIFSAFIAACDAQHSSNQAKNTAPEPAFEVIVSGTPGTKFSGGYMVVHRDGTSAQKTIDGKIPEKFNLSGSIVSINLQKKTTKGELSIKIIKNGKEVGSSETTAAYGIVSLATK